MIPHAPQASPTSMGGGVKSAEYKIALTGKTFEVLSSMLYKDPYLAVVRELSCNAYDAHVENGNVDQAFDIHLPNTLEPHFTLRDYGTGMSAESIDSVYTKFFESTKTHSNDVVGALGLGSKSPFSYTSNYTITSWHGGLKLVYSAFKSDTGIPSIALLDVSDSTEPTGLEVSFAVKQVDFDKFTSKVTAYFTTWGSVAPNISGGRGGITIKQVQRDFGGIDWFVAQVDGPLTQATAIQGNVPYPLNRSTITSSNAFRDKCTTDIQRQLINRMLELPLIMVFPIGSLDFAASREELQYTELTTGIIIDKLLSISGGIKSHIEKQVETLPSQWEVVVKLRQLRSDRLRHIIQLVGAGNFVWKGQKFNINTSDFAPDYALVEQAIAKHPLTVQCNKRKTMQIMPITNIVTSKDATGVVTSTVVVNKHFVVEPGYDASVPKLVVVDDQKLAAAKLKYHFLDNLTRVNSNGDRAVWSIGVPRGTKITDTKSFDEAVQLMLQALYIPNSNVTVSYTSKVTPPPSKVRRPKQTAYVNDTFKVLARSLHVGSANRRLDSGSATNWWSAETLDGIVKQATTNKCEIVYVPLVRNIPMQMRVPNTTDTAENFTELHVDFREFWNTMCSALPTTNILLIGVKATAMKSTSFVKLTKVAQPLETWLRFWMYANAKTATTQNAYASVYASNKSSRNVLMQALRTLPSTIKDIGITELAKDVLVFDAAIEVAKTAPTATFIDQSLRILGNVDASTGKPVDTILSELVKDIAGATQIATTHQSKLLSGIANLNRRFTMLQYLVNSLQYGSAGEIQVACAHVHEYWTIATA